MISPWDMLFSLYSDARPSLGLFAVIVWQGEMSPDSEILIKSGAEETLSMTRTRGSLQTEAAVKAKAA